jgi:hypothetical protein
MRRRWQLAALLMLVGAAGLCPRPADAQQHWAALDPNTESSSPVMWGATEDEARQKAVDACRRLSKTCANGPASTSDLREVFVVMCCAQPKPGCAAAAGGTRRAAQKKVQEMFADAGYKECSVKHAVSAATGKRQ